MSSVEIHGDIPMPDKQSTRALKYPFEELEVGQCFIINLDQHASDKVEIERQLRAAAFRYGKKLGKKFSCRLIDDTKAGAWRTE